MNTILVTGGAGFIGSNFVRHVYAKYPACRIVILDALTYAGNVRNLPAHWLDSDRVEFWYGNVRNAELVDTLVAKSDVVVHFAAESHVTRSIFDNALFFESDVLGTQVVANSVLKHKRTVERFIHISTSEVFGTAQHAAMDENHPLNPLSPYAAAKCGADRLVYSYWATYKIPAIIVRPFNNFGPYQHLEKVVPRFITSVILNEPLAIHGDGTAARDFLHVDDHCRALDLIINADLGRVVGEVINLGSGRHMSINEIASAVIGIMGGGGASRVNIGNRPGQVFRHTCDWRKAKELLQWEPLIGFEDGLKRTVDWYKANREWWTEQLWMRHIPIVMADGSKETH
ncbi:MAG: NAD-dependent epimerase/dehydratase family protein [Betaproteobacteria bacterium]|nr:MAG: NAD-dependent epimerase/dehydratase family protein [Betaproteobacteria bacterium]